MLFDLLRCPRCSGMLHRIPNGLSCVACEHTYGLEKQVPVLWGEGKRESTLEHLDYDALQPINKATIGHTAAQWQSVLEPLCRRPADILELGAGTGVLTEGLLSLSLVNSVVASDVSRKFMLRVADRLSSAEKFKGAVVCDANEAVFAEASFDVIVGRSVLHHLLDYDVVLRKIQSFLKPGGCAVFFEPVLEGKSIISLACSLILQAAKARPELSLPPSEAQIIRKVLRHQTKHAWYPQTRLELDKLEDKYIFTMKGMKELGLEIGYSDVGIIDPQEADPSYWSYVRKTLVMMGVNIATIKNFDWIGHAIQESYICSTHHVPSPMVYFVFRR